MQNEKHYSNSEITVIWKSEICIHSGNCVRGLQEVFNPQKRPWINIQGGSTESIINTVNNCPSGALTYKRNSEMNKNENEIKNAVKIKVNPAGPLMIEGPCEISNVDGSVITKTGKVFLCRCGQSNNKPYCDGSHKKAEFDK
jgi:uncharacterized Fe-S cluster protein YjdI